jgi:uncharacterized protein YggE
MAVISLTVLREAGTAREALDANNAAMSEVLARDEGRGHRRARPADRRLLDPAALGLSRQLGTARPREAARSSATPCNNTLTVRIRDLTRLGAILDTSVSLGVNQGGDVDLHQ